MQPWLAEHAWKALRTTSTMRCEVRTLPPQTAAVREGESKLPFGIRTGTSRQYEHVMMA